MCQVVQKDVHNVHEVEHDKAVVRTCNSHAAAASAAAGAGGAATSASANSS